MAVLQITTNQQTAEYKGKHFIFNTAPDGYSGQECCERCSFLYTDQCAPAPCQKADRNDNTDGYFTRKNESAC